MLRKLSYFCVFMGISGGAWALSGCSSGDAGPVGGSAGSSLGTSGSGGSDGGALPQGGSSSTAGSAVTAGTTSGGMSGGTTAAGGSAGTSTAGTAQGGAAGGSGGSASKMSAGCGKDNQDDPKAWTGHDITVTVDAKFTDPALKARHYWTRPPAGYDKNTPVPLTLWGQGCGQNGGAEDIPTNQSGAAAAAVQVELLAPQYQGKMHCYSAGPDGDDAASPELPYFDKVLEDTLANFCIDTSRIFMGGYSSGGWVSSLISCNRANVVRGVAWSSAGLQLNHAACTGRVAGMIMRGVNDEGTSLEQTIAARDSLIMRNGCTMDTKPWDSGDATVQDDSCVEYQGCMPGYPVVFCPVPGGHVRGDDIGLSNRGFWKFLSTLP